VASRFAGVVAVLVLVLVLAACSGSDTDLVVRSRRDVVPLENPPLEEIATGPCASCVFALLKSSDHYQQNGAALLPALGLRGATLGLMLEGSPDSLRDGAASKSRHFQIAMYESYSSHIHTLHRYTFNPSTERLSVELLIDDFDGPRDSTLRYDRSLLPALRRHCGAGKGR